MQDLASEVKQDFGYNLRLVQQGKEPGAFKPLTKGFGPKVYELLVDYDKDTFRCIYTIRFEKAVYVVDAFKKKSKTGIGLSKEDQARIQARLKSAEADYKAKYEKESEHGNQGKQGGPRR